jgi:hypothetical protein
VHVTLNEAEALLPVVEATSAVPIATGDLHLVSERADIKNVLMDSFGGAPIDNDSEPFVTLMLIPATSFAH